MWFEAMKDLEEENSKSDPLHVEKVNEFMDALPDSMSLRKIFTKGGKQYRLNNANITELWIPS